jgi:hypothetical protein
MMARPRVSLSAPIARRPPAVAGMRSAMLMFSHGRYRGSGRPCIVDLISACLDSSVRLLEHSDAAPVEVVENFAPRRLWLPIIWSRWPAANADSMSARITRGEENGTTEHKAMILLKRKVTAQGTENRSC